MPIDPTKMVNPPRRSIYEPPAAYKVPQSWMDSLNNSGQLMRQTLDTNNRIFNSQESTATTGVSNSIPQTNSQVGSDKQIIDNMRLNQKIGSIYKPTYGVDDVLENPLNKIVQVKSIQSGPVRTIAQEEALKTPMERQLTQMEQFSKNLSSYGSEENVLATGALIGSSIARGIEYTYKLPGNVFSYIAGLNNEKYGRYADGSKYTLLNALSGSSPPQELYRQFKDMQSRGKTIMSGTTGKYLYGKGKGNIRKFIFSKGEGVLDQENIHEALQGSNPQYL